MDIQQILSSSFWNNTVEEYLIALGIFVVAFFILKIFKHVVLANLKKLAKKTKTEYDDVLLGVIDIINWPFFIVVSLYISTKYINTSEAFNNVSNYVLVIVIFFYIVKGIITLVNYGAKKISEKQEKREGKNFDPTTINVLSMIAKIVIWFIAFLLLLQNLGVEITPLLAGMGIGGIAIAFALQAILGDIFASFSIYFDKPFRLGDFIIVGNDMGVVKKIGIKTTRIQTLQGQELIISNKELTESRVNNFKKMEKRRVVFTIGVTYQTPKTKLAKIPRIIRKVMKSIKLAEIDRVHFFKFGDSSLMYEIVYYIDTSDYNKYMDVQQSINLAIVGEFQKEKIEFAYPTQTLFIENNKT